MPNEDKSLDRIERVEKENRRLKLVVLASVLLSIAALALTVKILLHQNQALEAHEFVLKDSSGHPLARLGSGPVGACLEIYGKTKDASAVLCAGDDAGANLLLTTHRGDSRALISAGGKMYETIDANTAPSLLIAQGGKGLVSLTVGTDRSLGIPQHDAAKVAAVSVVGEKPTINLLDSSGKVLWTAP